MKQYDQNTFGNPLFRKSNYKGELEMQRIKASMKRNETANNQEKAEEKGKKVINMDIFRQDLRRQQRDFHQQNHEYLKMCGTLVRSSFDENKFNQIGQNNRNVNTFSKSNNNKNNIDKNTPLVHYDKDTLFSCSLVSKKFPIKQIYQIIPFKKESILFEYHEFLNPKYAFFLFQYQKQSSKTIQYKLQQTIQEGLITEFKGSVNKIFKGLQYFDYLYFINSKNLQNKKNNKKQYPIQLQQISSQNTDFINKLQEEQRELFNNERVTIKQQETTERIILCEDNDLVDNQQTLCFESIDDYIGFKFDMMNNFKNKKIFQKDITINTNIRNIISTEKIYLVEIIEQAKSYIELASQCEGTSIMGKVYEHLISKADEYLRLLCGYTESSILTIYNIQNYQEKIYDFLYRSVKLKEKNKDVRQVDIQIIRRYPVLGIWFEIPQNLLGFSRQQLHEMFYKLLQAIISLEQKMHNNHLYESLKIKKTGVKYM